MDIDIPHEEDSQNPQKSHPIVSVLATDGLWDMVSSEEAVDILYEALNPGPTASVREDLNIAQILFDKVAEHAGRKPGDDVTILVLVL